MTRVRERQQLRLRERQRGVAIYPEHGGTLDQLLAAADVAMYRAKKVRGGAVVEVAEA